MGAEIIVIAIFASLSAITLLIAGMRSWQTITFLCVAKKAVGTVIKLNIARNSDRRITYLPIIRFFTPDNSRHDFSAKVATSSPTHNIGDEVAIYYHPRYPRNAVIISFREIGGSIFAFLTFGLATGLFAIGFYFAD